MPRWIPVQGSEFRVPGSEFRVPGSGFLVQGSGFLVQGSGFRIQGPGFTVPGFIILTFPPQGLRFQIRHEAQEPEVLLCGGVGQACINPRPLRLDEQ